MDLTSDLIMAIYGVPLNTIHWAFVKRIRRYGYVSFRVLGREGQFISGSICKSQNPDKDKVIETIWTKSEIPEVIEHISLVDCWNSIEDRIKKSLEEKTC